ncbi:hypothetical protein C7D72_28775, partial [Klebsiella pneumoniae]
MSSVHSILTPDLLDILRRGVGYRRAVCHPRSGRWPPNAPTGSWCFARERFRNKAPPRRLSSVHS